MKKNSIMIMLALVFLLIISACQPAATAPQPVAEEPQPAATQPEAAPAAEEPQPAAEQPVEEPASEVANDPVTLTFWHAGPILPLEPAINDLVNEFMQEYPWITVKVEGFPFGEYFTKVDTATAGGNAPDVLWVDHNEVPRYAYYDTILPLDEFLPANYKDDWFEGPLGDSIYEGKMWAVPLHQSTEAIIYNQEILDAAGLTPPKTYGEAWTLEEFRSALEKVTKKGPDGTTEVWGFITNYTLSVYNYQPWIYAQGALFMDPERTTYMGYLDSDKTIAAAQWFADLHVEGLAPVERVPDMFQVGKVAFFQSNPFGLVDIENRYPDLKVGVMPMPCGERCAVNSGQWELGISSQTEHPEEAWLLVDFLTNFEGQKEWVVRTGYLPARKSVYESMPELKEYPVNIFMDGVINHAVHRPVTLAYQFFNKSMTPAIQDMNLGGNVSDILKKVAVDAQKELDATK